MILAIMLLASSFSRPVRPGSSRCGSAPRPTCRGHTQTRDGVRLARRQGQRPAAPTRWRPPPWERPTAPRFRTLCGSLMAA